MFCIELAEGSKRGGTTSVSLHYHVIGKLDVCTRFSNTDCTASDAMKQADSLTETRLDLS